jgi:hypothetical protein
MRFGIILAAVILLTRPLPASFMLSFPPNPAVNTGTAGNTFELLLTNTAAAPAGPFKLDSFNIRVDASSPAGITFTGVDANTLTRPYLFAGNSLGLVYAVSNGGLTVDWNDLTAMPPMTVLPGESYSLGRILYSTNAFGPTGFVTLTVSGVSTFSDFPTFNAVPYTAGVGTVQVTTPAPPAIAVFAAAPVLLALLRRRR